MYDTTPIERQMAAVASSLKRHFMEIQERLSKGAMLIFEKKQAGASPEELNELQSYFNFLKNWKLRLTACQEIMEQKVILIVQEGDDMLVVKTVNDRARDLIKIAEQHGGVVVGFEEKEGEEVIGAG